MSDTDSIKEAVTAAYESATGETPTADPTPDTASPTADHGSAHAGTIEDSGTVVAPATADHTETPAQIAQRQRDASGRFARGTQSATPSTRPREVKPIATPRPLQQAQTQTPEPTEDITPKPAGLEKAPNTWKVSARDPEQWAAVPNPIKEEIWRREREVGVVRRELAQTQGWARSFEQTVSPYLAMIRAEGGEPMGAIGSLLQTAAALRTAPPVHKAQLIANMVKTFGVPIDALDAALVGQGPPEGGQPQHFDPIQMRQQIKAELFQDIQAQNQERLSRTATSEVEAFIEEKEFGEDLRGMMGRLMAAYAEDNEPLSLDDAYQLAAKSHPEVSKVFAQREAKKAASQAVASTERAKLASSSVKSQPVSAPVGIANGAPKRGFEGIKQAALDAWNEVESR